MTSAEISALREQTTEMYKKVWSEWFQASHDEHEIRRMSDDDVCDCDEYDRAGYVRKTWNDVLLGLDEVSTNLLRMQCYAAAREQEGLQ